MKIDAKRNAVRDKETTKPASVRRVAIREIIIRFL